MSDHIQLQIVKLDGHRSTSYIPTQENPKSCIISFRMQVVYHIPLFQTNKFSSFFHNFPYFQVFWLKFADFSSLIKISRLQNTPTFFQVFVVIQSKSEPRICLFNWCYCMAFKCKVSKMSSCGVANVFQQLRYKDLESKITILSEH